MEEADTLFDGLELVSVLLPRTLTPSITATPAEASRRLVSYADETARSVGATGVREFAKAESYRRRSSGADTQRGTFLRPCERLSRRAESADYSANI